MKKHWFNFRPLCVIFMFLLLGTIFAFFITQYRAITIILAVATLVGTLIVAIIYKKPQYIIIPTLLFFIGVGGYSLAIRNFKTEQVEMPTIVTARIYQTQSPSDGRMLTYADSVYFNGEAFDGNILIYVYDNTNLFSDIDIGNIIEFEPFEMFEIDLFSGDIPNSNYFENDLKYSLLTSNVTKIGSDRTFAEVIKENVKDNLSKGLNVENTEIAFSALFGDKTRLYTDVKQAFQLTGIAHILAVSGLHVNIITAVLYKILGLCKLKGWGRLTIISAILLFYAYICNFAVSVIRAVIMSFLLMLAPLVRREYDTLNAISLAGIVIFLINPLCAFNVSFLMSFSCVLGIAFFTRPISKALSNIRAPKYLAETLAVCVSTCLSLIFIQVYFFGTINFISIIANLILIPLFTFAFEIIFCLAFLSLVIPPIAYLLQPINQILNFINIVAVYLSNLPFANTQTKNYNYFMIVAYFYFLLIIGRICTANKKTKTALTLPIAGIMLALIV